MIIKFDRSFSKSIEKLKEPQVKERLRQLIFSIEKAEKMDDISGVKAMKGHIGFYRIRMGDYRVGLN